MPSEQINRKEVILPIKIQSPTVIKAAGNKPKIIEEYIGQVNSKTGTVSIARMKSPPGWVEPGQTPEFDEYTVVLKGMLRVKSKEKILDIHAGEAIIAHKGQWVQYSTPGPGGAEYIAVCLPAFSPETVHRD
jgi:mannose-6-phosphate isomerase-like protein (cupin superfamily)